VIVDLSAGLALGLTLLLLAPGLAIVALVLLLALVALLAWRVLRMALRRRRGEPRRSTPGRRPGSPKGPNHL
jgi:membrane protein implicated in regulation of membrane protease activity